MEIRDIARCDWEQGVKYREIAEEYGVSESTVKSWAARYWKPEKVATKVATGCKKVATKKVQPPPVSRAVSTDQQLAEAVDENEELTPRQKDFCLYFSRIRNATQAYLKAYGCAYSTARANGSALLANTNIRAELRRLRDLKAAALGELCGEDVVEMHIRIAFADTTDFVQVTGGHVVARDSDHVDGQLISEISEGPNGVKIKLEDRQKSLSFLERYFMLNPMDQQRVAYEKAKEKALERSLESDEEIEDLTPLAELLK